MRLNGWARLGVITATAVAVVAAPDPFCDFIGDALRFVDMLAPKPGLSGLLLLALSPVAFLALLFLGQWIIDGFHPRTRARAGRGLDT